MQQLDSRRVIRAWMISGSIILAILAVAAIQLRYTYQLTVANTTERAAAKSFLISEWIAKSFDLHKYVLLETLSDFTVAELVYPSENSTEHERQTRRIIQRVERTPSMVFLGLLNSDCVVTHTSIGINLGFDAKATEREYCSLAKNEPIDAFKISNMFVSVDNTMNVTVSMAMLSELVEFQGFALAGLDLGFFNAG